MKWLELDLVLTEQILIAPEAIQQLTLGESTSSRTCLRRWHALRLMLNAISARELAITFHLALLTEDAGEDSLRLGG